MSSTSTSTQSALTFYALGFTLGIGSVIGIACFLAFGVAVYFQCPVIAPRCTARPKETIYHPNPFPKDKYECQDRGNPLIGWIAWVMKMPYDTMLNGIPGTGTRKKGLAGRMLQVNLDGVVMLRYHLVGFRLTLLITVLALGVILPVNLTANCYSADAGLSDTCIDPSNQTKVLTDFERTTIANISPLSNVTSLDLLSKDTYQTNWWWKAGKDHILLRLYAIAFSTWFVYLYAWHLLKTEWKEVLILRRVYYLEDSIWERRQAELDSLEILKRENFNSNSSDVQEEEDEEAAEEQLEDERLQSTEQPPPPPSRGLPYQFSFSFLFKGTATAQTAELPTNHFRENRLRRARIGANKESRLKDSWVFDPEERDTIPNIELYSVLVGNIPTSQTEVFYSNDLESSGMTSSTEPEWQISVVKSFFDQCVPNQPGYSSSVAAVTILPNASDLAKAWRSWYVCASALRRLSFIRSLIVNVIDETNSRNANIDGGEEISSSEPLESSRLLFGSVDCTRIEAQLFEALEYGPEQTAVYSREFAQAAFACCPLGPDEKKVAQIKDLETLKHLEKEALYNLNDAHHNLQHARKKATANALPSVAYASRTTEEENCEKIPISSIVSCLDENISIDPKPETPAHRRTSSFRQRNYACSQLADEREILLLDSEGRGRLVKSGAGSSLIPPSTNGEARFSGCPEISFDRCNLCPGRSTESNSRCSDQWRRAEIIRHLDIIEKERESLTGALDGFRLDDGVWETPSDVNSFLSKIRQSLVDFYENMRIWFITQCKIEDEATSKSTFAVVTFTSRQAAVAARHCLTDGRGLNQWISYEPLPLPPLADAAPCDLITCRGCCRPVTVSLGSNNVMVRSCLSTLALVLIYCFYTVPFTFLQGIVSSTPLSEIPFISTLWAKWPRFIELTIGVIPGMINTLILSTLPTIFKALANSSGKASSLAAAEGSALKFYWWFMFITAFASPYIASSILTAYTSGNYQDSTEQLLTDIANTLPTQTSFFWLNWLLIRFSMTLPSSYMLQINTFLFYLLGLKCCTRMMSGGMNGPVVPYRVYVDSGAAFLCVVTLSFVSPVVAPAVLVYYLFAIPLLRRNCIYVYRPAYDGGGFRWPFLFDIFISSMVLAQVSIIRKVNGIYRRRR